MSTINPLIDIPVTQYYFETFVVGAHHSLPHLIADLLKRKELAISEMDTVSDVKKHQYRKLISMIDAKLLTLDINELDNLEDAEAVYWVNELGRRVAIETNTFGRIRPETLDMLICLDEEDFSSIMRIASGITQRLTMVAQLAESQSAPVPPQMPRQQ